MFGSSNGVEPLGQKPLPETILIKFYDIMTSLVHNALNYHIEIIFGVI